MPKKSGAQRQKKTDNNYQQRIMTRIAKASKTLAAIGKDVARVSDAWGVEMRGQLANADKCLESVSVQAVLIPDGYTPPRAGVREPLKVGETVRIHEKQTERYKPMLDGVPFGVTATGTVTTAGDSLVEVTFGSGDKTRAAFITARHLVRASA